MVVGFPGYLGVTRGVEHRARGREDQATTWTEEERKRGQAWGLKTIDTFHTHGTPPIA